MESYALAMRGLGNCSVRAMGMSKYLNVSFY